MQRLEHRTLNVPMEIVRLEVDHISIREELRQSLRYGAPLLG
jgi:hypothetical protein